MDDPDENPPVDDERVPEVNEGDEKEAPRMVTELRPEQVRWFYKKRPGEKEWLALNGRDSLNVELAYKRHQASLTETGRTPEKTPDPDNDQHATPFRQMAVAIDSMYGMIYEPSEPLKGAPPKPDAKSKPAPHKPHHFPYRLIPLYWKGISMPMTRGTWFLEVGKDKWQPLDACSPNLVHRIEAKHVETFAGESFGPSYGRLASTSRAVCEVKDAAENRRPGKGAYVRWFVNGDVLLFNHSKKSALSRVFKLGAKGTKLFRGYFAEARLEDGPPPVTDLIFVLHGIGQKRARHGIVKKVSEMRESCENFMRENYRGEKRRPIFLPVDWRTNLRLEEALISMVTPTSLDWIRTIVNESVMDLMYYASPIHGREITRAVSDILNRMYRTYVANDVEFGSRNGRVCLVAHSLGAIIAFDLLTFGASLGITCSDDRLSLISRVDSDTPKLAFLVNHLFCLGSPLGIFLVARGLRGHRVLKPPSGTEDFHIHNVYHPSDPVAYRIEPLLSPIYGQVCPVTVHKFNARNPTPYENTPIEMLVRRSSPSATGERDSSSDTPPSQTKVKAVVVIPDTEALPYRIDYSLPPVRMGLGYLAALTAHQNYWTNRDVIAYLAAALYGVPFSSTSAPKRQSPKKS